MVSILQLSAHLQIQSSRLKSIEKAAIAQEYCSHFSIVLIINMRIFLIKTILKFGSETTAAKREANSLFEWCVYMEKIKNKELYLFC